jgi:hypothetical protein
VASRKTSYQGPSVRDVLRGRRVQRSVSRRRIPVVHPFTVTYSSKFPSLVGFEELGNSDVFETAALELRFSQSGELVFLDTAYSPVH